MKSVPEKSLTSRVMKLELPVERIEETVERMENIIDTQDEKILELYNIIRVLEIRLDYLEKNRR